MRKQFLLFFALILSACLSPSGNAPQVTATPEVTVTSTLPPASTTIPTATFTPTITPTPTPVAYILEALAAMSDEAKIAAAPSMELLQQEGQIAGDIDLSQVKVKVEVGHVVTYTYNGEHVAAHDLRLGMTVDQMSYTEYGKEMIQRVFFDNNWDYPGYTPSLEEREMLKEQILTMVEGSFAVNWGFREGEFTRPQSNGELKAPDWNLQTVANRNAFYEQVLLQNYRAAAANGTLFADGSVIPLDGGVQIKGQLPDVIVVFE